MNLSVGDEITVADSPEAISAMIYRVYTSAELWQNLSAKGLAKARKQFSFEAVAPQILKTLEGVLL